MINNWQYSVKSVVGLLMCFINLYNNLIVAAKKSCPETLNYRTLCQMKYKLALESRVISNGH